MNRPPEESTTVRRVGRRYRLFGWASGVTMTLLGAGTLIVLLCDPNRTIHHGILHTGNSSRAVYALAASIAALLYGTVTLTRLLKARRRNSLKTK